MFATDDIRIEKLRPLLPPAILMEELPLDEDQARQGATARTEIGAVPLGKDDRLAIMVGPCWVPDTKAALDYAARLKRAADRYRSELVVVMRTYFEKPRTTVGWKGLINDPDLDGSFQINKGLRLARGLLRDINQLGLPAGCEFLDMITPQFIGDLVAWGAIGARTTESQVHRELASGMSCPVGFKNGTDGNVKIAIDAVQAAAHPHHFLAVTKQGRSAIATTAGNDDCHIILRGGKAPNYDAASIASVCAAIGEAGLRPQVMIDVSHGNSSKRPENQPGVVDDIARQIEGGERRIAGV